MDLSHRAKWGLLLAFLAVFCLFVSVPAKAAKHEWKSGVKWPEPPVVNPGPVGGPPSDAIVLFDGKDLSKWQNGDKWIVKDGVATANGRSITTKQSFGDCQLHVEFASPKKIRRSGQGRGNSGLYIMGHYEVQILDSYKNKTYFDGQCGAVYKQSPPMVNASRQPGQWQTMDVIFNAPRFSKDGKVTRPASMTVLHNGVLIQNHHVLPGSTCWHKPAEYEPHPEKLPLRIQFHGNPVQYRNIWIRELKPLASKPPSEEMQNWTKISGRVYLNRRRISGVVVSLFNSKGENVATVEADKKGQFTAKHLKPGMYKATVKPSEGSKTQVRKIYTDLATTPLKYRFYAGEIFLRVRLESEN